MKETEYIYEEVFQKKFIDLAHIIFRVDRFI